MTLWFRVRIHPGQPLIDGNIIIIILHFLLLLPLGTLGRSRRGNRFRFEKPKQRGLLLPVPRCLLANLALLRFFIRIHDHLNQRTGRGRLLGWRVSRTRRSTRRIGWVAGDHVPEHGSEV